MSPTPDFVTAGQIAEVAGLTRKHVRRQIGRARVFDTRFSSEWFGVRMNVVIGECELEVEFASLPQHIREAFVMLDQPELPLPPPHEQIIFE